MYIERFSVYIPEVGKIQVRSLIEESVEVQRQQQTFPKAFEITGLNTHFVKH